MKATKTNENSTLAQIIKLVEEASNSKAPISKIADKVSSIFVPTVIIIALASTAIWLLAGHPFEFALTIAKYVYQSWGRMDEFDVLCEKEDAKGIKLLDLMRLLLTVFLLVRE